MPPTPKKNVLSRKKSGLSLVYQDDYKNIDSMLLHFFWVGGTTLDSSKVNHSTHSFLLEKHKLHKKLVGLVDLDVPLLLPLVKLEEVWVVRRREGVTSHRGHKRFGENFRTENKIIRKIRIRPFNI